MSTTSPDTAKMMAELKSAPALVKRVAACGALLGVIVLLSFCASAFTGHVGWGRALASGVLQFLLLWFISFSVQARHRWAFSCLGEHGWVQAFLMELVEFAPVAHSRHFCYLALSEGQ